MITSSAMDLFELPLFLKLKILKWTLRDVLTKYYTCAPPMNDCILKYNKMILKFICVFIDLHYSKK